MATAPVPTGKRLISYLPLCVAIAVVVSTQARFMGDTIDYVYDSIHWTLHSWDFGHLVWVPLGRIAATIGGLDEIGLIRVALAFNAVACVIGVVLMRRMLNLFAAAWPATIGSIVFLFSQATLNYSLTGVSYAAGWVLTTLALYLAVSLPTAADKARLFAFGSATAMAAATFFWANFVLVAPAVILAPMILRGVDRAGVVFLLRSGVAFGSALLVVFGSAAYLSGVRDFSGLFAWMVPDSSGGGQEADGVARMIFGMARSFVFMGYDGLMFKRYLLSDPYNPVSLADLVGASLWKFTLFYALLVGVGIQLLRNAAGRRLVLLAVVAGLPVIVFAVFWQGGNMERYLPLYPFFFIAVVAAYETQPTFRPLRWLIVLCAVIVIVVNGSAHSAWHVSRYQDGLADRVREVRPLLKPASVLIVVSDRLFLLPRDFPLDKNGEGLKIRQAVMPGSALSGEWKTDFAKGVLLTWQAGGDVWISTRCFAATPHADSTWAEGEDPRLKWTDVVAFFTTLETDGTDVGVGFVRLRETAAQRDRLRAMNSTGAT